LTNGHSTHPIVLTIAGFDPCGGAGIAADLKTISANNCYGVAAVTALTVQNTQGVKSVHITPAAELRAQIEWLLEDVTVAAVKIGMLGSKANAQVVAEILEQHKFAHVVLDPVAKAQSGGAPLVDNATLKFLAEDLMKRATVVTPNIAEAELLT
jgi:hydroxymethylpyrimidine/phosphomethylpyrimidine kinase